MDELQVLRDAYDALVESTINPEAFDFGSAYGAANERRLKAMREVKHLIRLKEGALNGRYFAI